jgi:hypothetical protein
MGVTQTAFRRALLDPAAAVPDGLSGPGATPAGRRFNVYRNNVAVSLTDALREGFPVLTKLLGEQNIDGLAGIYLRAHPPASPLMMHFGAALPEFLAATPQLAHLGYLPDVARLELALRRSYHAADATPIDPDLLGATDPDRLMQARLTLAPTVQLLRSDWPLFDIWRFNTRDNAPQPGAAAQDVLITRPEFDPTPQVLLSGGAAWIEALSQRATFGQALETAQTAAPDFDLGACLGLLLQGGAITALNFKE